MKKKISKENNVIQIDNDNQGKKRINKKKLIIFIIIAVVVLVFFICFLIYTMNVNFRDFCDTHIFFKHIEENNLPYIELDNTSDANIFAWSNYICVMKNNTITKYNSVGKDESEYNIEVTTPLISIDGDYLLLAEKSGQRIYLISKNGIVWQKDLEGNISRINVNPNGYVSVILSGTVYKSVIVLFDESGNELFKTYLSSTIAIDSEVSSDNKYLSFAEVNISGTLIQSNIKEISIDKAKQSTENSIVYTYNADSNNLITDIKYQDKNKLICQYDNSIHLIDNDTDKEILKLDTDAKSNKFVDINLNEYVITTIEENDGLFNTKSTVKIKNSLNQKNNEYSLIGIIKNVYCYGDRIALNLGSSIHFIDINGWLVKQYNATEEVRGVTITDKIAGVIYRNKIEIINL